MSFKHYSTRGNSSLLYMIYFSLSICIVRDFGSDGGLPAVKVSPSLANPRSDQVRSDNLLGACIRPKSPM